MTQMTSLLAIATVFIGLYLHFTIREGGGGLYTRLHVPMQELELKVQGGLYAMGERVIAGLYGNIYYYYVHKVYTIIHS